jgi:hypothetical protein
MPANTGDPIGSVSSRTANRSPSSASGGQASTDTVDWWERQQDMEPELCAGLLAICTRASIPREGGDGLWIVTK